MVFIICIVCVIGLVYYFYTHGNTNAPMEPMSPINVMVATDLHYISPKLTDHGEAFETLIERADGKTMEYSDELLDAFIENVLRECPDALVLTGDLTFNGAKLSHIDLANRLQAIRDDGIPVVVIPGNHDLNSTNAAAFHGDSYTLTESISAEQFVTLYADFGYADAYARDTASLSYVWEASPQLRFLMLDVNGVVTENTVPLETLRWVKEQLLQAKKEGVRILAFSHQNLLQHSLFTDGYVIDNSASVLSLYKKYDVIANFSGHLHIQHQKQSGAGFYEVATSALSVSPNQYALIRLSGNILQYQTSPVDVSAWAEAQKSKNADLLNFAEYARQFFWETGYQQALRDFEGSAQKEELAASFQDVNVLYFSGRLDLLNISDNLLAAWKEQSNFQGTYIESILQDRLIDHNTLTLSLS